MSRFPTSRSRNNARTCVYDECNSCSELEEAARFIHTHAPEYFTVRSTAGSEEGEDDDEVEGHAASTSPQDEDQETRGSVAFAAPPLTDAALARIVKRLSRGVVIRASNVGLCRDLVGCVTLRWGELVPEWASLGTTGATTSNSASASVAAADANAASLQGFIPELVVDPRSRRLGIASQLLDLAKQRLRHKGITSVYAQVMPHFHREAVFMFLHSCGFREFCRHAGRVVHVAPTAMRQRLPGGASQSRAAGRVAGNADEDIERQEQIVAAGATPRAPRARSRSPSRRSAARARLTHRSKSPLGPGMTALDVYDPSLAAFGDDGVAERSIAKHLAQHVHHFQRQGVGNGADDDGGEGCNSDEHHEDDYEDALDDHGCDGDDGGEYEHGGGSDYGQGPDGEWALGFEEEAAAAAERLMGLQMSASLSPSSSARTCKGRSPGRRGHPAHPTPRPHQDAFSMFGPVGPVADQQKQQESKSESRRGKLHHSLNALGLTTDTSTRTSTGTSIRPHPDTVNSLSPRISSSRKPSQPAQRSQSSQQFTETQQQHTQQQQQDHAHRTSSSSRAKHQMRPVNCLDEAQQVCVDRGIPANTMVQCRVDQAVAGTIARAHLDVAIVRLDAGTLETVVLR